MRIRDVAKVAHEVVSAYRQSIGQEPLARWEVAGEHTRKSAIEGVAETLKDLDRDPRQSHLSWMAYKLQDGWKWGEVKDFEAKTHPDLVPWDELPEPERVKDYLFLQICRSLAPFVEEEE